MDWSGALYLDKNIITIRWIEWGGKGDLAESMVVEQLVGGNKVPVHKFFNTNGLLYKSLTLKDKLQTNVFSEKQLSLLSTNGMFEK